jgi:hypothetical protein
MFSACEFRSNGRSVRQFGEGIPDHPTSSKSQGRFFLLAKGTEAR